MRAVLSALSGDMASGSDGRAGWNRRAVAVAVLLAVLAGWGVHAQELAFQVDGEADEFWDPSGRAQISGQVIVGAMIGPVQGELPQPATYRTLIDGHAVVCLALISQDGAYRFRQDYAVAPPADEEIVVFDFAPAHPEAFASERPFALRLSLGPCAAGGDEVAVVAASPDALAAGGEITVLVNGLGADRVWLNLPEAGVRVDCAPLSDGRATAFGFECPVVAHPMGKGMAIVERFRGSTALEPEFFTLVAP